MGYIEELRAEIKKLESELKAKKAALKLLSGGYPHPSMGPKSPETREKMKLARAKYLRTKAGRAYAARQRKKKA
jgi:hypothetical protein